MPSRADEVGELGELFFGDRDELAGRRMVGLGLLPGGQRDRHR